MNKEAEKLPAPRNKRLYFHTSKVVSAANTEFKSSLYTEFQLARSRQP